MENDWTGMTGKRLEKRAGRKARGRWISRTLELAVNGIPNTQCVLTT